MHYLTKIRFGQPRTAGSVRIAQDGTRTRPVVLIRDRGFPERRRAVINPEHRWTKKADLLYTIKRHSFY